MQRLHGEKAKLNFPEEHPDMLVQVDKESSVGKWHLGQAYVLFLELTLHADKVQAKRFSKQRKLLLRVLRAKLQQ